MLAQLKQVAITYVTRPTPLGWLAICAFVVTAFVFASWNTDSADAPGVMLPVLVALFGAAWGCESQLQWQFANPRAALIPRYKESHVVVWLLATSIFVVAWPIYVTRGTTQSPWFISALSSTLLLLPKLRHGLSSVAPVSIVLISQPLSRFQEVLIPWVQGQGYRYAVLVIVTIMSCLLAVLRTLSDFNRREDDPGYSAPIWDAKTFKTAQARQASNRKASRRDQLGALAGFITRKTDRAIQSAGNAPIWRRLAVTQNLGGDSASVGTQTWSMAVLPCVILATGAWQIKDEWSWNAESWAGLLSFLLLLLPVVSLVVGMGAGIRLRARRPQMAVERLYPIGNRGYTDALLWAQAVWAGKMWLIAHLLVAVFVMALPPQWVDPPERIDVAVFVLLQTAGVLCAFGSGVLFAAFHGIVPSLIAGAIAAINTLGLQGYWSMRLPREGNGLSLFWAIAAALAGVLMINAARTAWRDKEFG